MPTDTAITLNENELVTIIKALETQKRELIQSIPDGDYRRLLVNQIVELRNKLRNA